MLLIVLKDVRAFSILQPHISARFQCIFIVQAHSPEVGAAFSLVLALPGLDGLGD